MSHPRPEPGARALRPTRMSTRHRLSRPVAAAALPGAVLAAALLTGCGPDSTTTVPAPPSTPGPQEPPPSSSPTPPDAQVAQSVTVTRGGGIAGELQTFRVAAGDPLADTVLPLTDDPSIFAGVSTTATPPCCDLFSYTVYVDYAEGPDYRFLTWQGADVPPEVDELVSTVTNVVRQPDVTPTQ